jgi:hypothetical protein
LANRPPLLLFPLSVHKALQSEALKVNKDSDAEIMAFALLDRRWTDDRVVYQPSVTFVPKPKDYLIREGESCALGVTAQTQLINRLLKANAHLLWLHTHPPYGALDFSGTDIKTFHNWASDLSQLCGSPNLVVAVLNHVMSLRDAVYSHWDGDARQPIEVAYPAWPIALPGNDFTQVGARISGIHRCPRTRDVPSVLRSGLTAKPFEWTGRLLPSPGQPIRVLENTPGTEVMIHVIGWPLECDCYLRERVRQSITLAELGHVNFHPWRSG